SCCKLVLEECKISFLSSHIQYRAERIFRHYLCTLLQFLLILIDEITASFRRFGPLVVDWPHKAESKSYFPPKGYAFLLFQEESSVQALIDACLEEDGKLYLCVSSPTIKDKPVQIRPWNLSDSDFVMDGSQPLDPRKTIFVGGVPRPLRAVELAMIMDRLYGGVCYAGIDTDPELKYPKGAGRVAFSNQQSYIAAISARFVQLQHNDIDKRVSKIAWNGMIATNKTVQI
uniref:Insulin degrading enzyme n=1 Tax=Anser cygnoides TaxID=8845 RepID=A0A8B9DQX7_ANSCY